MNLDPARVEELWVRSLGGEALTPGEDAELCAACSADPALRSQLLQDERLDGLLQTAPRIQVDGESFARQFSDRLVAERGKTRFARRVEQRIHKEALERRPAGRKRWLLFSGLAAAGILIAILLVQAPKPSSVEEASAQQPPAPSAVATEPRAVVAVLEEVHGPVFLAAEGSKRPGMAGDRILPSQGVQTDAAGFAILKFPDGTRMEVLGNTKIQEITESAGKQIVMTQGTVCAEVAPQPKDRPLMIRTPQAATKVLGTSLRVIAGEAETRVDVFEGSVRLERTADKQAVDISAGSFAIAAPGSSLTASAGERRKGAVLFFDFEDRDFQLWKVGTPSTEFQRPGNRYCMKAGPEPVAAWGYDVHVYGRDEHLFRYSSQLVITFEYWAERGIDQLFVQMGHLSGPKRNLSCQVSNLKHEQWARATVPISQLKYGPPNEFFCAEGDWIWKLNIGPSNFKLTSPKFYIDNLQVAAP